MKLSFDKATGEFQVIDKGQVLDRDTDFDALATRNGFLESEESALTVDRSSADPQPRKN
ncbi:MAG: hypothetical protein U7123_08485 [Potamolinea sp.]